MVTQHILGSDTMLHVMQDEFRSAGRSRSTKPQQQRLTSYLKYAEQLEAVSSVWRLGPSSTWRQASALRHTLPNISHDISSK